MKTIKCETRGEVQHTVDELQRTGHVTHFYHDSERQYWIVRGYTYQEFNGDECHQQEEG